MTKPNFKLVRRVCKCGCGSSWKALPTSKNEYATRSHNNQETYLPWKTERSKFKSVKRWLTERFGEAEEKESDQEILSQIDADKLEITTQ